MVLGGAINVETVEKHTKSKVDEGDTSNEAMIKATMQSKKKTSSEQREDFYTVQVRVGASVQEGGLYQVCMTVNPWG